MKNLLTTLMVLLIVTVAGAALAGDMDWKFYGKLHSSIDYLSDSDESGLYMASNTSRFGFKGAKELNEDFTMIWQFENAINMAQKSGFTALANRNTFLGVKGDFGTVLWGIHDTPFKTLGRKLTFFYDELGDFRHATFGWDRRLEDILVYASPNFDGFSFVAGYQMNQENDLEDESMTAYSAAAYYAKDALFFGASVEGLSEAYNGEYVVVDDENVYADAPMAFRVGAKYNADQFAVAAMFQTISDDDGMWDFTGTDPVWEGYTATTFGVEALFRAAPKWHVKGSFYMANGNTDAEDIDGTDLDESDTKGSVIAFGVDHVVSKAVKFYAQFVTLSNGDMVDGTIGSGNGHGRSVSGSYDADADTYNSPMGISFGSVIKF